MSALLDLYKKGGLGSIEEMIMKPGNYAWEQMTHREQNELKETAAAELSALRERVAELEADKERTREAVRMARQKLQATQINWQEECLFQCNDLLGVALDVCPSCTWRGDVTLVNGGCPYCKTNWHELRKGE